MVILRVTHYKHRTILTFGVEVLDCAVVECAIILAETGLQITVVCTIPVAVAITEVFIALARITAAAAQRNIEDGAERRLLVNAPLVVEAQLRLVVIVVFRRAAFFSGGKWGALEQDAILEEKLLRA